MPNSSIKFRDVIRTGLLAGVITLSLAVIGFLALLGDRQLIGGVLTLGHVFQFAPLIGFAYLFVSNSKEESVPNILGAGFLIGILTAIPLILLAMLENAVDIRQFLVNVSPALMNIILFGRGIVTGSVILVVTMGIIGLVTTGFSILPNRIQRPILTGLGWTLLIGTFSEILSNRLRTFFGYQFVRLVFKNQALNPYVAAVIFLAIGAGIVLRQRREEQGKTGKLADRVPTNITYVIYGAILLVLPLILGTYLSEVMNNVGLYILMGLGLNIVVGFAGLLDLGYVAFFAIGAYVMGILTTEGHLAFAGMSFWTALPFAVVASTIAGILLGVPVLKMRGDYLAIVTLGFGEIIRILALSDWFKPFIGGAQGILQIPKPALGSFNLVKPEYLYYIILAGCLLAAFISWRLQNSRLGRQWMAMREDEDVAEAMGINLVTTKLLAFATGAAFSGLSGAIFASKLTSIFPHSFNLIVSINVLSLIIVGGIGSLPGVVVGALILVGLPELLREFAEYRMLMYGALLIVMMLVKPEGFWPSEVLKREMHAHEVTDTVGSE
jgi:branched-chain amino acid transport system permease protein